MPATRSSAADAVDDLRQSPATIMLNEGLDRIGLRAELLAHTLRSIADMPDGAEKDAAIGVSLHGLAVVALDISEAADGLKRPSAE